MKKREYGLFLEPGEGLEGFINKVSFGLHLARFRPREGEYAITIEKIEKKKGKNNEI